MIKKTFWTLTYDYARCIILLEKMNGLNLTLDILLSYIMNHFRSCQF